MSRPPRARPAYNDLREMLFKAKRPMTLEEMCLKTEKPEGVIRETIGPLLLFGVLVRLSETPVRFVHCCWAWRYKKP